MPASRPLPPRPSLEYARKEAKALLRRLRAGDPEAIARARARHSPLETTDPERLRLADAQLVVAREYGFASWPRMVRYLGDVERQQYAHMRLQGDAEVYEAHARRLLAGHGERRTTAGRSLAAYVPRFYGQRVEDVLASPVTEDEARLAVARMHGAPSWEVLLERLEGNARTQPGDWETDPMRPAFEALRAADLAALEQVVAAHPGLLHPSGNDLRAGHTLMSLAIGQEKQQGAAAMRTILEWLEAHGFERRRELLLRLCGHMAMKPGEVRDLLDLGADPNAVMPNGIPVLEYALIRYWNGEAVDVLAARATPRRALWIAAGLGDVEGVRRSLDARGRPTPEATRLRPDFVAVGHPGSIPALPDADDEELLLEALLVAMLNGRTAVLEYLASRGAPLNSLLYGLPLVHVAIGNAMTAVVECLVRGGADLDLRGESATPSPRQLARLLFEQHPDSAEYRRIVEICGMDPDAVLAERDARPASPEVHPTLREAIAFAAEDAARLGQAELRPENLLLGLLRAGGPPLYYLKEVGRMDVERLRAELADRIAPSEDAAGRRELPYHADAWAAVEAALALAAERRLDEVDGLHLLHALTRAGDGAVGRLLARYGVSAAAVHGALERALLRSWRA